MGKSKAESQKWRDRAQTEQEHRARQMREDHLSSGVSPTSGRVGWVVDRVGLAGLVARGELRRLIVRGSDGDGWTFTIKADVMGLGPSYLHGRCHLSEALPGVIDEVIDKGRWHADKYPPKD